MKPDRKYQAHPWLDHDALPFLCARDEAAQRRHQRRRFWLPLAWIAGGIALLGLAAFGLAARPLDARLQAAASADEQPVSP